jgi:hypothetical protein
MHITFFQRICFITNSSNHISCLAELKIVQALSESRGLEVAVPFHLGMGVIIEMSSQLFPLLFKCSNNTKINSGGTIVQNKNKDKKPPNYTG